MTTLTVAFLNFKKAPKNLLEVGTQPYRVTCYNNVSFGNTMGRAGGTYGREEGRIQGFGEDT
jgi:hypothetical protein